MNTLSLLLLLLTISVVTMSQELTFLPEDGHQHLSILQLVETFANKQGQIYQKVFNDYIQEEIRSWRNRGDLDQQILSKIIDLLTNESKGLWPNLKQFMQRKLFAKLQMQLLTESLKQQIREHPEDYYLTFQIYDLLID